MSLSLTQKSNNVHRFIQFELRLSHTIAPFGVVAVQSCTAGHFFGFTAEKKHEPLHSSLTSPEKYSQHLQTHPSCQKKFSRQCRSWVQWVLLRLQSFRLGNLRRQGPSFAIVRLSTWASGTGPNPVPSPQDPHHKYSQSFLPSSPRHRQVLAFDTQSRAIKFAKHRWSARNASSANIPQNVKTENMLGRKYFHT